MTNPTASNRTAGDRLVANTMTSSSRVVHKAIRLVVSLLCRVLFRMEVRNRERLPIAGAYILAPVHRSNVDVFVAAASVPSRVVLRTMAKDSLWRVAWFGRFLEKMGAFPVNRENPDRAALRRCEDSLAHGEPLLMFPEGHREKGSTVENVLEGPAWLACRRRVPVVPVGIAGTDRVMPIGARFMRLSKVIVEIGEPIIPDVPVTGRIHHTSVTELTDQIRSAIQAQYDRANNAL